MLKISTGLQAAAVVREERSNNGSFLQSYATHHLGGTPSADGQSVDKADMEFE